MKLFKFVASITSCFVMVVSPLATAKGKENERRAQLEQFLKNTGISTKKQTVWEYWISVRHAYPLDMRPAMDRWVSLNRDQMMPSVQVTNFKDANGNEQVRMLMTKDGQSVTATYTGNEDFPVKINSVAFSKKEMQAYDLNQIANRLIKEDSGIGKLYKKGDLPSLNTKNLVLKYSEFKKLTPAQEAEYFIRLRLTTEAATKVLSQKKNQRADYDLRVKYPWAYTLFASSKACADDDLTYKDCIIAGFITKYGENQSCGGQQKGAEDYNTKAAYLGASCAENEQAKQQSQAPSYLACNPLVYGFKEGGAAYCVPFAQANTATAQCNVASPLDQNNRADKERIINSYLKYRKKNSGDDMSVSKYLKELNDYIGAAEKHCNQGGRAENRPDQDDACAQLLTRSMDLQNFAGGAITPPAYPLPDGSGDSSAGDCNQEKPGSELSGNGKSCLCPAGTADGMLRGRPACIPLDGRDSEKAKKANLCNLWCRNSGWIIGLTVAGVVGFGLWAITKSNKPKSGGLVYTPPAGPAQDICVSPLVKVNNLCQAPVVVNPPVVEPPPTLTEGGSTVDTGSNSGGVR